MGQTRPLFVHFHSFNKTNIPHTFDYLYLVVYLDGVRGTRTLGSRMVGADEAMEATPAMLTVDAQKFPVLTSTSTFQFLTLYREHFYEQK